MHHTMLPTLSDSWLAQGCQSRIKHYLQSVSVKENVCSGYTQAF